MALPAPNLDDRRFQDLVDDAKRLVQQRCPEWTDHNVSDPGVTLIETFAYMVDQLIYRLNRVPDRHYVKFLELIGLTLFPPTPARTDLTFWLSAPQTIPVVVPAGTQVATPRNGTDGAVSFTTIRDLAIVPSELRILWSNLSDGTFLDHTQTINLGGVRCFSSQPRPGDSLLLGLSNAVPSGALTIHFDCEIEGIGVDPDRPPLAWEAFDGTSWITCELERDETGGLNRAGDVLLHIPASHRDAVVRGERAGWLRCKVAEPEPEMPFYSSSPLLAQVRVSTTGATCGAVHAELVEDEDLGISEGVAGQRFPVARPPVVAVPGAPLHLEVATGSGWERWERVDHFGKSAPQDRHFLLDEVSGEICFGPAVRQPDGSVQQYGSVPPQGAPIRLHKYWSGGGRRGNVASGVLTVLKTPIPFVSRVENRRAGTGGVDGEDLENAKRRAPLTLRTLDRAVTAEDFETLARQAAPDAARIRCVAASGMAEALGVRVLVVPSAEDDALTGPLRLEQLVPSEELLSRIGSYLDCRRIVGTRVVIEPPEYHGITVVARVRARPGVDRAELERAVAERLYSFLHPLKGGPNGEGWPFGRPVQLGELFGIVQGVTGVDVIEDLRMYGADPLTGERGPSVVRLEVAENALVLSYSHQVMVEQG